jgi:hypothetical protein
VNKENTMRCCNLEEIYGDVRTKRRPMNELIIHKRGDTVKI